MLILAEEQRTGTVLQEPRQAGVPYALVLVPMAEVEPIQICCQEYDSLLPILEQVAPLDPRALMKLVVWVGQEPRKLELEPEPGLVLSA